MKNYYVFFILIIFSISCSDNTIEYSDQEAISIEKRRPCSDLYHDIPCNDNIASTLVGSGLDFTIIQGDELLVQGFGTSGVFVCERECTVVGLLSGFAGEAFHAEYEVCEWQTTVSYTAEEQEALINHIVNTATIHAPSCNGEPMIPVSYDVIIDFSTACCNHFDVEVTWVSECDQSSLTDQLTP